MKKLFLFLYMALSCIGLKAQVNASDIDVTTLDQGFTKVFYSNIPVSLKMSNAKLWIVKRFGDYKSVLTHEDETKATIIIHGKCPIGKYNNIHKDIYVDEDLVIMDFTLTLDFKDDRYRAKIEDIVANIDKTIVHLGSNSKKVNHSYTTKPITSFCKDDYDFDDEIADHNNKIQNLRNRLSSERLKKKEIEQINEEITMLENIIDSLRGIKMVAAMHRIDTQRAISQFLNALDTAINTNDDF